MTTEASLRIRVDSSDAAKADKTLDDLAKTGAKAEDSTTKLTTSTERLSSAARVAAGAFAALGLSVSVREIVQANDAWQSAANQLRLVTTSAEDLTKTQSALMMVANDTRSSFESTANLYTRLSRATSEMGLSQTELLGITETINQSFAVSGATAAEAAAAITQLSQGLAAGALRGDEFNSVAEQAPGIMRAIAESLNMTTGELRSFAAEGGITAEIVVNALQGASDSIADDFGKSVQTFGQSMQIAQNNMLEFVGGSDLVVSSIGAAGQALVTLTENLDELVTVLEFAATLAAARFAPAIGVQIVGAFTAATAAMAASTVATTRYNAALMVTERTLITTTVSQKLMNGAMALVGGPAGLAVLAAVGVYKLADAYLEHEEAIGKTLMSNEDMIEAIGLVIDENGDLVDSTEAATKAADDFQRKYKITTKDLVFFGTAAELTAGQVGGLAGAVQRMTYIAEGFVGPMQKATYIAEGFVGPIQKITEATEESSKAAVTWADTNDEAARTAADAWGRTHEFLSDTFVDIFNEGGSAFQQVGDMAVATAKRIAAEWLALKAMNLFGISAPSGMGGGGAGSAGGSLVNTAVSSGIKALIGGGGSAATTAAMTTGGTLGGIAAAGAGGTTAGGVAAAAGGGAAGGGMLAGAGAALSGAGSSIMAGIAAIPGWGWAIGAAALAAAALSKKETPSGNAGFLLRPVGDGERQFDVPAFDSGFDPVGFARREDQSAATAVIDTFRQYDAALTGIAEAAGLSVNYSANNFGGFSEKGQGGGTFFGTANEDGRTTNVPVEQQLTQFVSQWIRGLSGQVDPALINDVLAQGSADEMLKRAAMLAGVDASAANGLDYVPSDNYRISAHRGEEVVSVAERVRRDTETARISAEMAQLKQEMRDSKVYNRRSFEILDRWQASGFAVTT